MGTSRAMTGREKGIVQCIRLFPLSNVLILFVCSQNCPTLFDPLSTAWQPLPRGRITLHSPALSGSHGSASNCAAAYAA
jgi:hypothetical protein